MATYTIRNDLIKPDYTDAADIDDLNDNFDFIDGSIAPCEWAKNTAPTANDDVTLGYIVGSLWFDTTNHKLYICEDNTDTAAVWRQLYPAVMDLTGAVLTDGSKALTADWDAGGYEIRSNTFESDVATGTAPFTIASETMVNNLNADMVDGKDETAFALLAGRSGSQTLYGGVAKDETLTLYANSKDATGAVKIPNGGLEIGTKATTATYGAINIHEGAAGAANAISFLDGDGTTSKAAIYKDSGDSLFLSAGGTSVYVAGSNGRLVSQAGMNTDLSPADGAFGSNISMTNRPYWTADATHTYYGIYDAIFPEIRTGKTQGGNVLAYYTECMRNHNGAATDDDGTLANLVAFRAVCGHYSLNSSMKGTTTNAYCFQVSPYCNKGTITNLYGIYIGAVSTGGTITNQWPFYSAWNAQHYFGGDIYTVGNCSALTFTDRTPGYEGDGLADLKKIKNKDGKIDHTTLPAFARKTIEGKDKEIEDGRDLGAMISILVKAVQQLEEKLEAAYKKHDDAEKRIAALEARLAKHGI